MGKTELVRVLSQELFDSTNPLIRLDMSEFMEEAFRFPCIVGGASGYVGYDEAGQLTEKVRRRPYSVILFDEIEKSPSGRDEYSAANSRRRKKLTDAHGRTVSFENTVIVMTSQCG